MGLNFILSAEVRIIYAFFLLKIEGCFSYSRFVVFYTVLVKLLINVMFFRLIIKRKTTSLGLD